MRELAQRLLEATRSEARAAGASRERRTHEAVEVFERLRVAMSRLAGADGFAALLRRALALARVDAPMLKGVQLGASGQIEGLEEAVTGVNGEQTAVALAAHLLDHMATFIGQPLTLRLVHDVWPELEAGPNDTPDD